jgi:hypothetical protein
MRLPTRRICTQAKTRQEQHKQRLLRLMQATDAVNTQQMRKDRKRRGDSCEPGRKSTIAQNHAWVIIVAHDLTDREDVPGLEYDLSLNTW